MKFSAEHLMKARSLKKRNAPIYALLITDSFAQFKVVVKFSGNNKGVVIASNKENAGLYPIGRKSEQWVHYNNPSVWRILPDYKEVA